MKVKTQTTLTQRDKWTDGSGGEQWGTLRRTLVRGDVLFVKKWKKRSRKKYIKKERIASHSRNGDILPSYSAP